MERRKSRGNEERESKAIAEMEEERRVSRKREKAMVGESKRGKGSKLYHKGRAAMVGLTSDQ